MSAFVPSSWVDTRLNGRESLFQEETGSAEQHVTQALTHARECGREGAVEARTDM